MLFPEVIYYYFVEYLDPSNVAGAAMWLLMGLYWAVYWDPSNVAGVAEWHTLVDPQQHLIMETLAPMWVQQQSGC